MQPAFAGAKNFESFTYDDHMAYSTSIQRRRGGEELYWLNNIFAVPKLAGFDRSGNTHDDKMFVAFACYHPSAPQQAGHLKDRLTDLIIAHNALLWDTYGEVIAIYEGTSQTPGYRRTICLAIKAYMDKKLAPSHPFGAKFAQMKREYMIACAADEEARRQRNLQDDLARNQGEELTKPAARVLEQKSGRIVHDKVDDEAVTVTALGKSFEVDIRILGEPTPACRQEYQLRWTEDDGSVHLLEPISFPNNVVPVEGSNEKRFVA